jgi:acetylornithine deacetylase/succinyl-diaminopimelate desuccinylase-like protein
MDPSDLLIDLVNIRTDGSSNKEMIVYLKGLFKQYQVKRLALVQGDDNLQGMVVKIAGKDSRRPVVFVMHTDTVVGDWFKEAVDAGDEIVGLGSADMKSGIACVCAAVSQADYDRDVYLVFTCDEEMQARSGYALRRELTMRDAIVIVPEPSARRICVGQNGCVSYRVTTTGVVSHGSLATEGDNQNAINKMIAIAGFIDDQAWRKEGIASQNIGYIEGGTRSNIVPEKCIMKFEQRYLPGSNIVKAAAEMSDKLLGLGASNVEISFLKEGLRNEDAALIERFKSIVDSVYPCTTDSYPAWTEAATFKDVGECFIFGPGDLKDAHKPQERVRKDDLKIFTQAYRELLRRL